MEIGELKKFDVVNIQYCSEDFGLCSVEGVIISTKNTLSLIQILQPFNFVEISKNRIVSVENKQISENLFNAIKQYTEIIEEREKKKKEFELITDKSNMVLEGLKEIAFIDVYTSNGAINYLNNLCCKLGTFEIDDNLLGLKFAIVKNPNQENEVPNEVMEVTIKATRKFEFFNTTDPQQIEKASETYAPDVKEALKEGLSLFENIFLVSRKTQKISEYLYASISEYNGEFNCTKTNFFEQKKKLEKFIKKNQYTTQVKVDKS